MIQVEIGTGNKGDGYESEEGFFLSSVGSLDDGYCGDVSSNGFWAVVIFVDGISVFNDRLLIMVFSRTN